MLSIVLRNRSVGMSHRWMLVARVAVVLVVVMVLVVCGYSGY